MILALTCTSGAALTACCLPDPRDSSRLQYRIQVLLYLEKMKREAALAGGAFHAINGNHETMNVQGRFRYASAEGYKDFERSAR